MNEQNFCSECERPIGPEDCHTFDGALLCKDCYRTLTAECDCCGTRICNRLTVFHLVNTIRYNSINPYGVKLFQKRQEIISE